MSNDKVRNPEVLVNNARETAILLFRGDKYSYLCRNDRGLRVDRVRHALVSANYRPLHYYIDGHPDDKTLYRPEDAARKYLNWGMTAGITEVAERALLNIIKGVKDMSTIEGQAANQKDTRIPSAENLGAALEKATTKPKKASTKNGTTAAAKRPSKAKSVAKDDGPKPGPTPTAAKSTPTSTPKGTTVKKTTKPSKATSKASPKAATKAKAPAAKKAAPAAEKKGTGRPTTMNREKTIKVLAEDNPRREGSQGYDNWPKIKRYDGKKVGAYLDAGGGANHLRFDINVGNVKLV